MPDETTPALLSDAEIERIIDMAIGDARIVRDERSISDEEDAETDEQIATLERLRATLAAYREIVAAVAKRSGAVTSGDPDWSYCMFAFDYDCEDGPDEESVTHAPDCPWVKARALLAGTPAPGTTGATAGESPQQPTD